MSYMKVSDRSTYTFVQNHSWKDPICIRCDPAFKSINEGNKTNWVILCIDMYYRSTRRFIKQWFFVSFEFQRICKVYYIIKLLSFCRRKYLEIVWKRHVKPTIPNTRSLTGCMNVSSKSLLLSVRILFIQLIIKNLSYEYGFWNFRVIY